MGETVTNNQLQQKTLKGCLLSEENVDIANKNEEKERMEEEFQSVESDRESYVLSELKVLADELMACKKKGKKNRVIEPQMATRKS